MMEKNQAVFSAAYLPPIQYMQLLLKYGKILLEKHETYPKQTYRNRCIIYSANGPLALIIPVVKPSGNSTKTADVKLDNSVKWRREHHRALISAYKNSAFFEFVWDYFAPFYEREWEFLWDYNIGLLNAILSILEIDLEISETHEFIREYSDNTADYRWSINPKREYFDNHEDIKSSPYYQVFGEKYGFQPNLSVFDLICNCGMDSLLLLKNHRI